MHVLIPIKDHFIVVFFLLQGSIYSMDKNDTVRFLLFTKVYNGKIYLQFHDFEVFSLSSFLQKWLDSDINSTPHISLFIIKKFHLSL